MLHISPLAIPLMPELYRVSIKSFPDYKHLLQEHYVEYKHIFFFNLTTQEVFLEANLSNGKKICLYSSEFSCNKCLYSGKEFMLTLYYGNAIFRIFHNYSFISVKHSGDLCFMMENMTAFVHVCQYS